MSRPWLATDERARAVALADAVAARTASAFQPSPMSEAASAAFRAVRSLAVADVSDATPSGKALMRGPSDPGSLAVAAAARAVAEAAERAAVEAQALADARAAYDAELDTALDHARDLIRALGEARAIDGDALAAGLRALVLDLAGQVVEAHVAADPAFITARVDEALATLKSHLEPGRLVLNPQDLALLDIGARFPNLTLIADAKLARGSLRLEAAGGEIEDGVDVRMAQLRQGLGA